MCIHARNVFAEKENLKKTTKEFIHKWSPDEDWLNSDDVAGLGGIPVILLRLSVIAPSDFPQKAIDSLIEQKIFTPEELNQEIKEDEPSCCGSILQAFSGSKSNGGFMDRKLYARARFAITVDSLKSWVFYMSDFSSDVTYY